MAEVASTDQQQQRQQRRQRRRREAHVQAAEPARPYLLRKLAPYNVLSDAGLELIEANADKILAETGMEFRGDPEVLEIFASAGCDVDGERVRFAPGFCRTTIICTVCRSMASRAT